MDSACMHAQRGALLGGLLVGADARDGADALGVQAQVLRVRLAHKALEALVDEEARGKGVLIEGARRKALVRDVEEGDVLLLDAEVCDLVPLLLGRVDARGVVRAPCTAPPPSNTL